MKIYIDTNFIPNARPLYGNLWKIFDTEDARDLQFVGISSCGAIIYSDYMDYMELRMIHDDIKVLLDVVNGIYYTYNEDTQDSPRIWISYV